VKRAASSGSIMLSSRFLSSGPMPRFNLLEGKRRTVLKTFCSQNRLLPLFPIFDVQVLLEHQLRILKVERKFVVRHGVQHHSMGPDVSM